MSPAPGSLSGSRARAGSKDQSAWAQTTLADIEPVQVLAPETFPGCSSNPAASQHPNLCLYTHPPPTQAEISAPESIPASCLHPGQRLHLYTSVTLKGHFNPHPCTSLFALPPRLSPCNQHSLPPTEPPFPLQILGQRPFTSAAGYLLRGRAPQRHTRSCAGQPALTRISPLGAA